MDCPVLDVVVVVGDDAPVSKLRLWSRERDQGNQEMEKAAVSKDLCEPVSEPEIILFIVCIVCPSHLYDDLCSVPHLLPPLGLPLVRGLAHKHAVHPAEEEEHADDERADAEVDETDVEDLEGRGLAHEVHDSRERQEVVACGGHRVKLPVEEHHVHHVPDPDDASDGGVETEDEEEPLVVPPDAVAEKVAVVIQHVYASPAMPAMVRPHRHVHVAGLALLPVPGHGGLDLVVGRISDAGIL